ncbi:MAG: efflux RND transporter periplasmic adaptor subunit [Bacteroidota bacterium]
MPNTLPYNSPLPRLLSLFLPILGAWLLSSCNGNETTTKLQRRNITQAVYASGKIYPIDYYRATTGIPGYIQRILVKVGDSVKAGQSLFEIRNEVSELNVATAKNNLNLAKSNASTGGAYLQTLEKDVDAAGTKLKLDSVTYERYNSLRKAGIGTRQTFDQAEAQFKTSREIYEKAQSALSAARQRSGTEVKNAENIYRAQQSQLRDFTVKATLDGKVYDIMSKEGEYVSPQIPVMELGRSSQYEVELAIDETDINLVHPGMEVVYSTEAFAGTVFEGKIKEVYPKISQANKSIKAIATINLPAGAQVYAGSTLEANIIFARRKNALVVAKVYIAHDSAIVKGSMGNTKVKVQRGIEDVEFMEIVGGVSAEDVLVKP